MIAQQDSDGLPDRVVIPSSQYGFGDNTSGDSYGKSSPENILKDLKQL